MQKKLLFLSALLLLISACAPAVQTAGTRQASPDAQPVRTPIYPEPSAGTPQAPYRQLTASCPINDPIVFEQGFLNECPSHAQNWNSGVPLAFVATATYLANTSSYTLVGTVVVSEVLAGVIVVAVPAAAAVVVAYSFMDMANKVDDPALVAAVSASLPHVATDWGNPAAWMSMRHPEAEQISSGLVSLAGHSGILQRDNKGRDDCSTGLEVEGVCLFAAIHRDWQTVSIVILRAHSGGVQFFAINGTVSNDVSKANQQNWMSLGRDPQGTMWYLDITSLFWKCAWWMAERTSNGHGRVPVSLWLDRGSAWQRWIQVRGQYALTFEILEVPLPPLPF